jgi:hypothetical protein
VVFGLPEGGLIELEPVNLTLLGVLTRLLEGVLVSFPSAIPLDKSWAVSKLDPNLGSTGTGGVALPKLIELALTKVFFVVATEGESTTIGDEDDEFTATRLFDPSSCETSLNFLFGFPNSH